MKYFSSKIRWQFVRTLVSIDFGSAGLRHTVKANCKKNTDSGSRDMLNFDILDSV